MFAESTKGPFIPEIVLFAVLVSNEFVVLFVDRVVRQMHVFVLLVYFLGVGFGRKTR
jgi:hypothetical protein